MAGQTRIGLDQDPLGCLSLPAGVGEGVTCGTAGCGPACPVVWGAGANHSRLPDWACHHFLGAGMRASAARVMNADTSVGST
jgi:hypothetical protein